MRVGWDAHTLLGTHAEEWQRGEVWNYRFRVGGSGELSQIWWQGSNPCALYMSGVVSAISARGRIWLAEVLTQYASILFPEQRLSGV